MRKISGPKVDPAVKRVFAAQAHRKPRG